MPGVKPVRRSRAQARAEQTGASGRRRSVVIDVKKLVSGYVEDGKGIRQLAGELKISYGTARARLIEAGIELRPKGHLSPCTYRGRRRETTLTQGDPNSIAGPADLVSPADGNDGPEAVCLDGSSSEGSACHVAPAGPAVEFYGPAAQSADELRGLPVAS